MNRFNLEWAIASWRRQYETRHTFGRTDLDELERHLRDQTAWFVEHGMPEEEAFRKAVAELGTVFEAEDEYRKVFWKKLRLHRQTRSELSWRLQMGLRYIRSGMRAFARQKVVSFINVFGLSVALASAVCTYIFVVSYMGMDHYHENGERVWLVNHEVIREGQVQTWGSTPLALAPVAEGNIAGVERAVRAAWRGGRAITDNAMIESSVLFADVAYRDVLTVPVASGDPDPLRSGNGVAITQAAARNLFGQEDPLGKTVTFSMGGLDRLQFTVASVLAPLPGASGTRYDILAPFHLLATINGYRDDDWSRRVGGTMLLLEPGADPVAVQAGLNRFIPQVRDADPEWPAERFVLDCLLDRSPSAYRTYNRLMEAPHPVFVFILILIPVAMLLLSVVNYINIAIGSAERRLREIGIRKVVGGQRSQLVTQFLMENLVLCTVSLVIAGFLSWAFLLPMFDRIFVYSLTWAPVSGPAFWMAMLGLLLGTAFVSGAYPALYISSFKPVTVFRGRLSLPARRFLSHSFLTIQFVIAFICILLGLYMAMGNDFESQDNWGYDPESIVSVSVSSTAQARVLQSRLVGRADIRAVSPTLDHVGFGQSGVTIMDEGREETVGRLRVGTGYFETLGLPIERGRGFGEEFGADEAQAVVVTPALVKHMGWGDPMDRTFRMDGRDVTVVGVTRDPVLHPLIRYRPLFFSRMDETATARLVIAGNGIGGVDLLDTVAAEWKALFPEEPFDGMRQTAIFDIHIESWRNLTNAIIWLAALALVISCLGLFGLSSQAVLARLKEVSIRKVLGANPFTAALKVHTRYLVLITIGAAIAMPLVYLGITIPLRMFEIDYITVGADIFVIGFLIVLATAAISVTKHTFMLARANPADTLRGE